MLKQREKTVKPGGILPLLALPEVDGGQIKTWDFRGRRNLLIIYLHDTDCKECQDFLKQLTLINKEFLEEETELLIIIPAPLSRAITLKDTLGLPGHILADETGEVTQRLGLRMEDSRQPVIIITDRYGEIYYETNSGNHELLSVDEILSWLRFIENQCPE